MTLLREQQALYFYDFDPVGLRQQVSSLLDPEAVTREAVAVMVPHAGYKYSGAVAGAVFSRTHIPRQVIVLAPNHRGLGRSKVAVMREGAWQTPWGNVEIDSELADAILDSTPLARDDPTAHLHDHAIEVQLPFLLHLQKDLQFVPINLRMRHFEDTLELARGLVAAVRAAGQSVLLVASTDMSHQVSHEQAERLDLMAVERILEMDARGLFETVFKEGISMCGVMPTCATVLAARELGTGRPELVRYATSGAVTGDYERVVGYAGVFFPRAETVDN
jgi:MEMO1 family protein